MHYEEWAKITDKTGQWGVKGFFRPVYVVWGFPVTTILVLVSAVILGPVTGVCAVAALHQNPLWLLWMIPSWMAFHYSGRGFSCIDLAGFAVSMALFVAIPLAVLRGVAGLAPFSWSELAAEAVALGFISPCLTSCLAGLLKSYTLYCMEKRLVASRAGFDRLQAQNLLYFPKEQPASLLSPEPKP